MPGVWVGCHCVCGAREKNLVNCLVEMASASVLVALEMLHGDGEMVLYKIYEWGADKIHDIEFPGALALPHMNLSLLLQVKAAATMANSSRHWRDGVSNLRILCWSEKHNVVVSFRL